MSPAKGTPKFIAYYRVSTDRQGRSGLGLDAQREAVRQRLTELGGFPPALEFTEIESGRNPKRPELAKALAACRVRKATLIVAKLDRLTRNQAFLMSILDSGVDVIFGDLPQVPDGAMGRFLLQQMGAVAELEAGLISKRTKDALRARVQAKGQWDRKAKHHLVPGAGQQAATAKTKENADARAADLADTLRSFQAEGLSLRGMASRLNADGIATARGAAWTATAVRRVLARLPA